MAGNGMSIIEAINEIVETVGEFPMSTSGSVPDGTGTSIYHRARQFLDRESKRVQSQGWPENTTNGKAYTADGSGHVSLANTVLSIRGSGPDSHRDLSMRVDTSPNPDVLKLYDNNKGTFVVATATTGVVFVDQVEALAAVASDSSWGFEVASPMLQDVIVDSAKVKFQRRIQGNLDMDTALQQERMASDHNSPRNQPLTENRFNVQPLTAKQPRQQKDG